MGGRGSLSGFTASPNFSKERAQRVYQNALDVGFSKSEALERVRAAQYQVERMAKQGGTTTKRDITSSTYERERKRNQKQVDALFRGRW